jgi:predicted RNase H-like nuclease
MTIHIAGLDLAWGERRPDGICLLEATRRHARITHVGLSHGDQALLAWLNSTIGARAGLLAVDAPLICVNATGARPVDGLTHVHFGRYKCGCHPTNSTRQVRPLRLAREFAARGYALDWRLPPGRQPPRLAFEVYPHPAMVRLFGLPERIPYKRGPVTARRVEFKRLQHCLRQCLAEHFPALEIGAQVKGLLRMPWTKNVEDQTDGFFCALIGYWHWLHRGARSQVLGDRETGFLVVPRVDAPSAHTNSHGYSA